MVKGTSSKPVVFLAFANDREQRARYLRNLPEEVRRLRATLEAAERADLCELLLRQNVTLDELFAIFQRADYRDRIAIFHYGGHANGYELLLESSSGGTASAHVAGLAELLGAQRGLQLVFLNGCATEPQAQGLLAAGVPAVLATSQAIDDATALAFAGHFYAGLIGGASLETAYAEAKAAVIARQSPALANEAESALYRADMPVLPERWPWQLYLRDGAEQVLQWNLPDAAGDPLFGLPTLPPADLPEQPYRHLQPFTRDYAEVFFGRGVAIRALYERVTGADSPPLILLYGRSGVGKSSLLEAGLLPRLEQSHVLCYRRRDHARGLWGTLISCLGENVAEEQALAQWQHREAAAGKPLIIVLDQVEEVYTRPDPQQPDELAECLDALQHLLSDINARPQGKLILSFRKEWLPEFEQALAERELPRSTVYLQPLDRHGLIEAILGPAQTPRLQQRYGLSIEEGLAETIADALLTDPEAPLAPTLQILLAKLWVAARARDPAQPQFDSALFQTLQREGLLLGDYLDQQLAKIEEHYPEAVHSGLVLDLLAYHTTSRGTAETHSTEALQQTYAHCHAQLPALMASCQDGYLLLPTADSGTRLGHDTLAPLIRERFEESDCPGQRARRTLENRAVDWTDDQQGTVLDEADLVTVETGIAGMRVWTADEKRLVDDSRRERDKRVRKRRRQTALGVLSVGVILVTTIVALWQWHIAINERDRAEMAETVATERGREVRARQLAAEATLALTASPMELVKGALLAAESLKRVQTLEGSRVWAQAMALLPWNVMRLEHEGDVDVLAFSPDGSVLGTLMNLGDREAHGWVRVMDVASGTISAEIQHEGSVSDMAFSPDGRLLATVSWDHTLIVTDVANGERLYRVLQDAPVSSLAFSSDGRHLAIGGRDGSVCVKHAATGADVFCVRHEAAVIGLAFTPEGHHLLTGSEDKTARVWDVKTAQELHRFDHATKLTAMRLNRDGSLLATVAEEDPIVRIWDVASGELALQLRHDAPAHAAEFSPDGAWIVTGAQDHTARIWDARTGVERHSLAHQHRHVRVVGISPNGKYLATVNGWWENEAAIWNTETGEELFRAKHDDSVIRVAFAANSQTLATSTDKGAVWLWDLASRNSLKRLKQNGNVNRLSFSPDGQRLAAAILKGNVYGNQYSWGAAVLWDADTGTIRHRLGDQPRHMTDMAFSPKGALLATGSYDGMVRLWDADTGTEQLSLKQEATVSSVKFTPEDRLVATTSTEAAVWDLNTAQNLFNFSEAGGVLSLQVSADGRRVLTEGSTEDRTVRIWNVETGVELYRLADTSAVLSPNGRFVAHVDEDGETIEIIDLDAGKGKARLSGGSTVKQYRFDPEGKRLAVLYEDNRIAIWDITAQAVMAHITHTDAPRSSKVVSLIGGSNVARLNFSPNGQLLATQGFNTALRVWEASTGTMISQLIPETVITSFSFSNDGHRIITVSLHPKVIHIWDTRSGEILHEIAFDDVSASPVFSPDDSRLVFGHRNGLDVWDTSSWQRLLELSHDVPTKAVRSIAFSPDSGRIATGGVDGTARVWDATTGEELLRLQHDDWVAQVAFSANGTLLLTRDTPYGLGRVRAWTIATGKERFRFVHGNVWQKTAYNRSGSHVATASGTVARVWSTRSGEKVAEFRHDEDVELMSLDSDGRRLATVQADYSASVSLPTVQLWDVTSGLELFQLKHKRGVNWVGFSGDDKWLLTAAGGIARIWDTETGREVARFTLDADIHHMILSEDKMLLAASYDGGGKAEKGVAVWDVAEKRLLARLPHYENDARDVDFQPSGTTLATADGSALVRIWEPLSALPELLRLDHEDTVFDTVVSPDSTRLAAQISRAEYNYAPVWDLTTGKEVYRVKHDEPVWDVAMSPDGKWLATASSDRTARVWDAANGRELVRLPHDNKVHRVEFSPDSRWLATYIGGIHSGRDDQWEEDLLRVWDADSGQATGLAINGYVKDYDFSPDGRRLATGEGTFTLGSSVADRSDRLGFFGVRIWDVATGAELLRIPTERPGDFVAFSPNGKTVASLETGHYGEPIRIWDANTGVLVKELVDLGAGFKGAVRRVVFDSDWKYLATKLSEHINEVQIWNVVTGIKEADLVHEDSVSDMAFSPDGRYFAAQSGDTVSVWDWTRGRKLIELHPGSSIYDLQFTPDGSHIVTAGDGLVQVWLWKQEDLLSDACSRLERNLTRDEWRTYLDDEPYRPTCPQLPND